MNEVGRVLAAPACPCRVAVLLPTTEVGGHEHMLFQWLSLASQVGVVPNIYCAPGSEIADMARRFGLQCQLVDYAPGPGRLTRSSQWRNFRTTLSIADRLPRAVTIVLAPGAMQAGLSHVLACRLRNRRIACYVPMAYESAVLRASRPAARDWVTRRLASSVALWITITEHQRELLVRRWGVRTPVHVVPNCLAVARPPPARTLRDRSAAERLKIAFIGRFDESQKGLDWLTEVLTTRPEASEHFGFVFQGRGEFQEKLNLLALTLGSDRITVLPWGDIVGTLGAADVLLLSSRFEGFPLVAIEAIRAGLPVIATHESGLSDVVAPQCLFPFGDTEALLTVMERMRSPTLRQAAADHAEGRLATLLSRDNYERSVRDTAIALCSPS